MEFIKKAKEEDLETEATAVTISEVDPAKVKELADIMGAKFVVRQYTPFFW